MHLGTLIHQLQSEDDAGLALEALGDLVLFTEIANTGARFDETPAAYIASAAARFANLANDQDWLDVIGAAERAHDPARAILIRILRWALKNDEAHIEGPCARNDHHPASDNHASS
jgi:hypothetical protein